MEDSFVMSSPLGKLPRCVFCGMDGSAKFGQGELCRFRTSRTPARLPEWYINVVNAEMRVHATNKRSSGRLAYGSRRHSTETPVFNAPVLHLNGAENLVGDYCSFDACRRLQEGKIIEIDGKPALNGLPNAFADSDGRPFGFIDELNTMGWPISPNPDERLHLECLLLACAPREGGEGSWFFAHHCCASWSDGVVMNEQKLFEGVEEAAHRAMHTLCALCLRLGASLTCRADGCTRSFHFPCAAGAGCYQEVRSLEIFCPSHLDHVLTFGDNATPCLICEQTNDVSDMIFCTSCGNHFHNSCLEPPLVLSVTVRVGWQCPECKMCLACSESKDETKMLVCDVCDKGFHTYCLKPPVTNIPKNGFKCDRCRVCTDCGLRRFSSKGASNSIGEASDLPNQPPIRWHSNYTLCERCFQGRKRQNACCAVCERAWRCSLGSSGAGVAVTMSWPGRKCSQCQKMVHFDCDPVMQSSISPRSSPSFGSDDATLSQTNGYLCPPCRNRGSNSPSEGASATASLRTSPNMGGSSSCCGDVGDDGSVSLGGVPHSVGVSFGQSEGSPWGHTSSSIQEVSDTLNTANAIFDDNVTMANSVNDSTSTTPTTEPGKQSLTVTAAGMSSVEPLSGPASSKAIAVSPRPNSKEVTRSHKSLSVSRSHLHKSKSVSSVGDSQLWQSRKRSQVDSSQGSKSLSKVSSNLSLSSNLSQPTATKTLSAKRNINSTTTSGGTRARRNKNRKAGALAITKSTAREKSGAPSLQSPIQTVPRVPSITLHKLVLPNSSMLCVPLRGSDRSGPQQTRGLAAAGRSDDVKGGFSASHRQATARFVRTAQTRRRVGRGQKTGVLTCADMELLTKVRPVRYIDAKHCWAVKCESKTYQEKDDHPSTVVICRTDDLFMLEQDICLACGSIGDPDTLIACAQCGQCFHTYCADVSRISRTMLEKGWRCLDCTICEGCGQNTEENLLLLCDECDVSYHTFCLKPPLKEVPKGGWKCSNCVSCTSCGSRSPGVNGDWQANFTRCAPCVSLSICPVCTLPYRDSELLIKCAICSRWSHAGCDQLRTEDELDFITDLGYNCALCRELGAPRGPGHQQLLDFRAANGNSAPIPSSWKCGERIDSLFADRLSLCSPGIAFGSAGSSAARSDEEQGSPLDPHQFFMDGVVLSETGLNTIRQVMLKGHPKRHVAGGRRASHPCASSATPDAGSVNDCAPASVFTPIDDEASQQSAADAEVETISTTYAETKSPSVISEEDANHQLTGSEPNPTTDRPNAAPTLVMSAAKSRDPNAKGKSANASARRQLNLGVGGFRARSTRMYHPKKTQLAAAAAGVVSGGPLSRMTQPGDSGMGKKRRPTKHKSNLEESYPDYLMQAFYGGSLLAAGDRAKKRRRKLLQQASLRSKPLSSALQLSLNSAATPSPCASAAEYGKPVVDAAWSGGYVGPRSVQSSKMPSPRSGFTSPSNPPPRQTSWTGGITDLNPDSPLPEDFDMEGDDDGFEEDEFEEELCTLEDPGVSFGIYKPSDASSLGRHDENLFADVSTSSSGPNNLLAPVPCAIDVSMEPNRQLPISVDQSSVHRLPVAGSSAHVSARMTPEPSFVEETPAHCVPIDSLPPSIPSPKAQPCLPPVLETASQLPENLDEVTDLMLMDDLLNIAAITNEDLAGPTPSSSVLSGQLEEPRSPRISPMQGPISQPSQRDSVSMMQNIYATGVSSSSTPNNPQGGHAPLLPGARSKMPPFDRNQTSQRGELISQVSTPVPSEYLEHQTKDERLTGPSEFPQLDRVHSESSIDTAPLVSDRFSPHVMNQQSLGPALYIEDSRLKIATSSDLCQMQRNTNPMQRLPVGCQSPTQASSSALGDSQSHTGIGLLPELSVMDIESQLNEFERNDIYRGSQPTSHSTPPMQLVDIVASPKSGSDMLGRTQMSSNLSEEPFSGFQQESLPHTPHSYTPSEQSLSMKAKPLSSPHDKTPRGVHPSGTHISSMKPLMVRQSIDSELSLHQECGTPQASMLQQQHQNLDESYMSGTIGASTPRPQSGQVRYSQRPPSGMLQSGRVCNSQAFMQQQQPQQQHQIRTGQRPVHVVQSYSTQPQQAQIPIQRQLVVQQQQQAVPVAGQQLRQIVQPHQSQPQSVQQFYVGQQHPSAQYVQTPTESTPPPPPYPVSHNRPMKWPQQYSPIAGSTSSVPQSPHPYQQQQSPTQKNVSSPPNPSALQFMSPQQQQRIRPHFKDSDSLQQQALFQAGQRVTLPVGAYQSTETHMTGPITAGRVMVSPGMSVGPSASSSAAGSPRGRTFQQQHFSYETSAIGGDPSAIRAPTTGVGVDMVNLAPCTEGVANQQLKSMLRQDVSPRMSGVDVLPTSSVPTPSPAPSSSRINYANWEADERRGDMSTIAPILHANILHPHLRSQVLDFPTRAREIHKLWRRLPSEKRCDFVNQARLNRTQLKASQNASNLSSRSAIHSSTGPASHFTMPSHGSTSAQIGPAVTGEGRGTPTSPNFTQSPVVLRQSQSYQDPLHHQQQQQQQPPQQPHTIYTASQDPVVPVSPRVLESLASAVSSKTSGVNEPPEGDIPSSELTPLSHHSDGSVAVEMGQVFASTGGGLDTAQDKPQKAEEQLAVNSPSNPPLSESVFFPHETPTDGVLQYPAYTRCVDPPGRSSSNADSLSVACGTPLHPSSYGSPSVAPSHVSSSPSPNGSARHLQNPPCTPKTPQMNRGLPSASGPSISYASQPPSPMLSVPSSPSIGQLAPQQPHQQQPVHLGENPTQVTTQQPHLPPPPPPTWPPSCYTSKLPTCQAMYSAAGSSGASSAGSVPEVVSATSTAVYKSGVPSSPVSSAMRSPVSGFVQPSTPMTPGAAATAASPRQPSPAASAVATAVSLSSPGLAMQRPEQAMQQHPGHMTSPGRPGLQQHQLSAYSSSSQPHLSQSSILSTADVERQRLKEILAEKVHLRQYQYQNIHLIQQQHQLQQHHMPQTPGYQYQLQHHQQQHQTPQQQQQQHPSTTSFLSPAARTPHMTGTAFFSGNNNLECGYTSAAHRSTTPGEHYSAPLPPPPPSLPSHLTTRSPSVSRLEAVQSPLPPSTPQSQSGLTSVSTSSPVAPPASPMISLCSPPVLMSGSAPVAQMRGSLSACEQPSPSQPYHPQQQHSDLGGVPMPMQQRRPSEVMQSPSSYCPLSSTASPYQSSSVDLQIQNPKRSPYRQVPPSHTPKADSNLPPGGLEETGFEPPVIVSRVIGKERRLLAPPTPVQMDQEVVTVIGAGSGAPTNPGRENAFPGTSVVEAYNIQVAECQRSISDEQSQMHPLVTASPFEPELCYQQADTNASGVPLASSQRLHPTPEPVPPQYFTSVPGRLPVSQPLSSPHTPTRPQRVGSGLEPSTTHLDDVIAHVVSDAVAYANQPGDSGSSMSPRHRKLQPPGSYASNQINDSSTPFKISENPAMPVGRSPVLSQDPGEPRITGHSSGSVTFVQDFSTGTYGYGAGVGGGRANAYVASRFPRRSPIQSQQQHCTSPGMQQVGSQHCSVMYANAPVMRPSPSPVDSQHPEYVSSPYDHHQQQLQSQNVDMNSGIFGTHNSEVSPSSTVFPSEMHSPSPHSRPSYSSQTVAYNYVPQSPYASQSGSEGTPSSHIRMTPMNCFEGSPHGSSMP